MSELNQNNRRLSRLAIISKHVAAHRREHFGTVWDDFWRTSSFFSVPVYSATLHRTLCPSPLGMFMLFERQRCCVDFGVFLMLMEDAWGCLMSSKCCSEDAYYMWQVMRILCSRKLSRRALSHSTESKVCVGPCVLCKTLSGDALVSMTQDQELKLYFSQPTRILCTIKTFSLDGKTQQRKETSAQNNLV